MPNWRPTWPPGGARRRWTSRAGKIPLRSGINPDAATAPGGRALVGVEFWATPPSGKQLAAMWEGTTADDALDLPALVGTLTGAGWRPLHLHESSAAEWDAFEFAHTAAREEWLTAHPSEPGADMVRRQLDAAHQRYPCGHRSVMGFATLLLARA